MSDYTGTGEPGSLVLPGFPSPPSRPQPTDPAGDMADLWVKVGAQAIGGEGEFDYSNGYFGGDSGIWKQA